MIDINRTLCGIIENEYRTIKVLKQSERGAVSLIQNKNNGVKFIYRKYTGDGDVYNKLMGIRCKNLPEIMYVELDGDSVTVLEEYIEGDSLDFLLKGGKLTQKQVKKIIMKLSNAVWVLHSFGAVHRDIKPENIIIRGDEPVLIDFDASRIFKSEQVTDTLVLGTVGYAAPEQFGISQTDGSADIYSLGVLLNVCLTGEHPSNRLADGRLGRIVQKCTNVNPKKRYKNILYLMEAL